MDEMETYILGGNTCNLVFIGSNDSQNVTGECIFYNMRYMCGAFCRLDTSEREKKLYDFDACKLASCVTIGGKNFHSDVQNIHNHTEIMHKQHIRTYTHTHT